MQSHKFVQNELGGRDQWVGGGSFRNMGEINKRALRSLTMVRGWCCNQLLGTKEGVSSFRNVLKQKLAQKDLWWETRTSTKRIEKELH